MFSDYLRRVSQPLLLTVVRFLSGLGLTPNVLTVLAFVFNVAVAAVIASGHLRWGGVLILLASLFDSFDGAMARYANRVTPFGAFLDSTLDRYSEAALFTGIIWHFTTVGSRPEVILAAAALFGGQAVSYTRARAEGLNIPCTVGLFTRVERMLVLAVGLALGQPLLTLWVMAILSHFTALQRMWYVRRQTSKA